MSQITRCPSCATKFKVVADQLRISDGWVRCGQCKEVFDASAHLLPSEPQALLPDVSMIAARPPPTPVVRAADVGLSWGASPSLGRTAASPAPASTPATDTHDVSWGSPVPDAVLDVPVPAVPAFLVSGGGSVPSSTQELVQQPPNPFAWRSAVSANGQGLADGVPSAAAPSMTTTDASALASPDDGGKPSNADTPVVRMDEGMVGYELPFAELRDAKSPESAWMGGASPAGDARYPPLELPPKRSGKDPALGGFGDALENAPATQKYGAEPAPNGTIGEPASSESVSKVDAGRGDELLNASLCAASMEQERDDLPDEVSGADEVSFVRAAKRKAFWRRPFVRVVLAAALVALLCSLALQVVLQERDRIAAMDTTGVRPWLQRLCEPFQCALAPLRQISDVMIDSSSFRKGRGDSYQLTFAIKNRAPVPLATPAMELTLTDAHDQPVLRRVFLPQEMAAPTELPALGEWTTSVAVVVTTGGARVAGYRLVAFYP
jgi:predicted Zn finger-like uncharacterized protein